MAKTAPKVKTKKTPDTPGTTKVFRFTYNSNDFEQIYIKARVEKYCKANNIEAQIWDVHEKKPDFDNDKCYVDFDFIMKEINDVSEHTSPVAIALMKWVYREKIMNQVMFFITGLMGMKFWDKYFISKYDDPGFNAVTLRFIAIMDYAFYNQSQLPWAWTISEWKEVCTKTARYLWKRTKDQKKANLPVLLQPFEDKPKFINLLWTANIPIHITKKGVLGKQHELYHVGD